MIDKATQDDLLALLAWWREAGVDVALEDEAIDWTDLAEHVPGGKFLWPGQDAASDPGPEPGAKSLAPASRAPVTGRSGVPPPLSGNRVLPPSPTMAPQPPQRQFSASLPDAATMSAREAARSAATLEALEATLRRFDGCGLKATAKNLCFYRGSPQAKLMIIGEAPGRDEDLAGRPFVGRAGQLLDKMLAAIGLTESDVHITNVVYWRPPGNRTPTLQEVQVCRPFLERQIELVAPEILLTLGGPASKAILNVEDGIMRIRGKWRETTIGGRTVRVMPTLHPAYLLRTPAAKRQAWRDLLAVKMALAPAN